MPLKKSILNALKRGQVVAAEVQATSPNHRAWVGVYPLEPGDGGHKYRIRQFEVAEEYLVDDNDVWEETMENKADLYVHGEIRQHGLLLADDNFDHCHSAPMDGHGEILSIGPGRPDLDDRLYPGCVPLLGDAVQRHLQARRTG